MKVLTGELRGRSISFAADPKLRPTSDKTRKAVLDSIKLLVYDARVLDLYSGTGAFSIEALSCGARSALLVEKNASQAERIRKDLQTLGLKGRATVMTADAEVFVASLSRGTEKFDLVFLDPPYALQAVAGMLKALDAGGVLETGAAVVAEAGPREAMPEECGSLRLRSRKRYGDTQIAIYQNVGTKQSKGE